MELFSCYYALNGLPPNRSFVRSVVLYIRMAYSIASERENKSGSSKKFLFFWHNRNCSSPPRRTDLDIEHVCRCQFFFSYKFVHSSISREFFVVSFVVAAVVIVIVIVIVRNAWFIHINTFYHFDHLVIDNTQNRNLHVNFHENY